MKSNKEQDDLDMIMGVNQMSDNDLVDFLIPRDDTAPIQYRFAREILLGRLDDARRYKEIIINWGKR